MWKHGILIIILSVKYNGGEFLGWFGLCEHLPFTAISELTWSVVNKITSQESFKLPNEICAEFCSLVWSYHCNQCMSSCVLWCLGDKIYGTDALVFFWKMTICCPTSKKCNGKKVKKRNKWEKVNCVYLYFVANVLQMLGFFEKKKKEVVIFQSSVSFSLVLFLLKLLWIWIVGNSILRYEQMLWETVGMISFHVVSDMTF